MRRSDGRRVADAYCVGEFLGRSRRVNAGVRIAHYSNGNFFPRNAGLSIPLTFALGYTFQ
jgi:hypothetical protein